MKKIRTFFSEEEGIEICQLLEDNAIPYSISEEKAGTETVYMSFGSNEKFNLLVPDSDAEKAMELIDNYYMETDSEAERESLLDRYDDEDLVEILAYPENHSATRESLAKTVLYKRGFSDNKLNILITQKINDDNKPQRIEPIFLVFAYITALFGGISWLWIFYFSKAKHTKTGQKFYYHDEFSRRHIRNVLIIGTVTTALYIYYFASRK